MSKIKTFAEWVLALTKGYTKVTGKKPDKLSQLKINMEAGQKVRDQEKILTPDFGKNKPWYKVEGELTHNDKIDWLVKNVDQNPVNLDQQAIPPKATLEAMLKELIKLFIRTKGRNPNNLELLQLKFKAAQQSGKGKVIEFSLHGILMRGRGFCNR